VFSIIAVGVTLNKRNGPVVKQRPFPAVDYRNLEVVLRANLGDRHSFKKVLSQNRDFFLR
jgi:hypothetical protein